MRDKGHLVLVASMDHGDRRAFAPAVPLTQTGALLRRSSNVTQKKLKGTFLEAGRAPSVQAIPLHTHGDVNGVLLLVNPQRAPARRISSTAFRVLSSLLATTQLVLREQRRSSRLRAINKICQSLESIQSENKLYRQIVSRIQRSFHYDHVAVYVLNKEANVLVLKTLSGKYEGMTPRNQTVPIDKGIVGWVASHGRTLLSNDVRKTPFFLNRTPKLTPTKAELCVPLRVGNDLIGVLNIEHHELLHFDDDDINSIEVLADRIGVAIKNAQLYAELQKGFSRLQEVVSSIGQGLMMIDRHFQVQWINETLKQWGFGKMVGKPCYTAFGHSPQYCQDCPGFKTFTTGVPYRDIVKSNDGRYMSITSAPITDTAGRVTHVIEVFDDVTASVRTSGELESLKRELEESQQLASIGELAASIVHEVRNPINAMVQAVGVLEADLLPGGEQRQMLDVLKEECQRLNGLLGTYLSLTPRHQRRFLEHDVRHAIEAVVNLLSADPFLARRVRITLDFPRDVPLLRLDANAVKQVFWNLLLNAVESLDADGTIVVRIRVARDTVKVSVRDSGRGIKKEELKTIFEPFYTTKGRGTGLGLAIVKRIIEDHEWKIHAHSDGRKGTCVTITIPRPRASKKERQ